MEYSEYIEKTLELDYQIEHSIIITILFSIVLLVFAILSIVFLIRNRAICRRVFWGSIAIFLSICAVFGFRASINKYSEKKKLELDILQQETMEIVGIIDDIYSYKKGRIAVSVDGVSYKILSQTSNVYGDILEKRMYRIWVLKNSKYVCRYQLEDDIDVVEENIVRLEEYGKFSNKFSKITMGDYLETESILRKYVQNYYQEEPEKYQEFLREGWMLHNYYREDYGAYVGFFQSLKNEESYIYLMVNVETGVPICFVENW